MARDAPLTVKQFTATSAMATCPPGSTLVGGGDELTSGGAPVQNDGSVTLGVYPSDSSGTPDSAADPASWTATGGYSAVTEGSVVVNAYAMCASGVATGTVVETSSGSNLGPVTATCLPGTSLIGGGGGYTGFVEAGPNDTNNTKLFASFPSDPGGDVPTDGSPDPTAWTVFGNSNQSTPLSLAAFAVCATGVPLSTKVAVGSNHGPVGSGGTMSATATCPANSLLLDGGIALADAPSGVGQAGQGVHVIGDFPSSPAGIPFSGATQSWTASGEDGGRDLTELATEAVALCLVTATTSAPQSISFSPPSQGTVGSSATLSATGGGSGNPVAFRVDPASGAGICSLSGPNGATVSYAAAGSCVLDANQAGSADFLAAPQVSATISVTNVTAPTTSSTTTTTLPIPGAPGTGGSGLSSGPPPAQSSTGSPPGTHPTNNTATPSTATATRHPASPGAAGAARSPVGPGFTVGPGSFGTPISGLLILSAKPAASPPAGTPAGGGTTTHKVLVVPHHRSKEGLWISLVVFAVLAGGIFLELRQSPRLARFTNPN